MAALTWGQIEAQKAGTKHGELKRHHAQAQDSLAGKARKDLARLQDVFGDDDIFRFRLSGKKRLWGFRRGRVFHAVFWDPSHKVYPTEKS